MLWIKKLLFATILGTSIISPSVTLTRKPEAIERLELEKTLKKWNRLFEKVSGGSDMEKLSKIFAKNLTTFSKSALVNAVKQLLMGWAIQIWENQEAFFPISQRLNKFFFYHHIYHWKSKNEVEELSWELIKKFFIDFFFNEKGWFLLSQFGDFSSFVLKEWEEKEKPMKLYEWKMPYSNAGEENSSTFKTSKLYDPTVLESLKTKTRAPYLFPEIEGNKEYSSLISRLTHKNEIELNLFKKKWVTISDLSTITDGYALGALLHMYSQQNSQPSASPSDSSSSETEQITTLKLKKNGQTQSSPDPSKNPLYIFAGENGSTGAGQGSSGKCLSIDSSLFQKEVKKEFKGKEPCFHGVRWINQGNEGGGGGGSSSSSTDKPKILVSREKDGISFYYLANDSQLKGNGGRSKTLNQQEPEVIKKVTEYLTENFETIFAKFLVSKKNGANGAQTYTPFTIKSINSGSGKNQTLDFSEFFKKNQSVIEAAVDYLDDLYWTEKIKVLQNILLSVYKHAPKKVRVKRQDSGNSQTIQLTNESGLFAPLAFKRSNGTGTDSRLELPTNGNGAGETNSQKNEFFEDLLKILPSKTTSAQEQKISLKKKAEKLKELIKSTNGQKIFSETSLKNLFLDNPYFRAQLEAISGDKLKAIDTIFALKAEEILFTSKEKQQEKENDFSELLKEFTKTLKNDETSQGTQANNTWEDLINTGLFLEPFLTGTIEKKLLFGSLAQGAQGTAEASNNTKQIISKAKNDWILDNYYFSDSGYESSASNYKELLAFLLSVKWLTENNHANFAKLINHIFSKHKNKNAYLVWTQEITAEQKKTLEGASEQQQESQVQEQSQPETTLKTFFAKAISTELSNPLLKGEYTMTSSTASESDSSGGENQTKNFSTKNSIYETEAYKNGQTGTVNSQNNKTKLSGFLGLVTESFSTREVPSALKNYIFSDFLKFNSTENKNYSVESSSEAKKTEGETFGIVEGAFFSDNHKRNLSSNDDLLNLLKEAKKKGSLLKYLNKETANSLLVALSKTDNEDVGELTLQQLKDELSKVLKTEENSKVSDTPKGKENTKIKELYKLFNRFSGYIYSSQGKEQSPFVFTEKKEDNSEEKYYVGFVYQVNRFDFDKVGIEELKKNLSENTLNTLIVLLASNREIRDWIYESEIIRQLSL